jgi:hypothetical protein
MEQRTSPPVSYTGVSIGTETYQAIRIIVRGCLHAVSFLSPQSCPEIISSARKLYSIFEHGCI